MLLRHKSIWRKITCTTQLQYIFYITFQLIYIYRQNIALDSKEAALSSEGAIYKTEINAWGSNPVRQQRIKVERTMTPIEFDVDHATLISFMYSLI